MEKIETYLSFTDAEWSAQHIQWKAKQLDANSYVQAYTVNMVEGSRVLLMITCSNKEIADRIEFVLQGMGLLRKR